MVAKLGKCLVVLVVGLFFVGEASAQATVSGRVTDAATGDPLAGANVVVEGTALGDAADASGSYSISNVPSGAQTVTASMIGYASGSSSVNVPSSGSVTADFSLAAEALVGEDIVVIGYTTQVREKLTGSVATIQADELSQIPAISVAQRMQGRVSGVTITNSHSPGGAATLRVRGLGTINNNDPLFVIDGVPTKYGLTQLNPNDIESISVLKDAASAAIYGARGANGVIIITTKRGKLGAPKISFEVRSGSLQALNKYDLLNAQEYGELLWLEAEHDGVDPGNALYGFGSSPVIPDYILPAGASEGDATVDPSLYDYSLEDGDPYYLIMKANKEGTDWYDEMFQTAPIQEYNVSITGGTNNNSYAFSGGYMREDGILLHTGFERFSIRSNVDVDLTNWLKVGESLGFTYTKGYGNRGDNSESTVISQGYRMQPIIPVYDIMDNWGGTKAPTTGNGNNPIALLVRDQNDYDKDTRSIGNLYAQANVFKDVSVKSLLGFDYRNYAGKDMFIKNPEFSEAKPTDRLNMNTNYTLQWNWTNTVRLRKTSGAHNVDGLLGTEAVSNTYRWFGAARSTFFSTDPDYMFLNAGEADQMNSGLGADWRTLSYFGRLGYDYGGKWLLQATFRRDGSSRFGANNRWGDFPALSTGMRILPNVKVRFGWGQSGNDEIGNYNGFTTFRTSNVYSNYSLTGADNSSIAGFDSDAYGNPDAKWEITTTTNIGVDASLLQNMVSITFDVWQRNTQDMLYQQSVPDVFGKASLPSINIGDMKNTGFDLLVNYSSKPSGPFTYSISANISSYTNEIVKLTDNVDEVIFGGTFREMVYTRAEVGSEFPQFYGYIVDGIFQTQAEADAHPSAFGADGTYNEPGHFKFRDVNGDGVIDADDRDWIGSPHPDFTAGLTFDLGYKNLGFSAFFYSSQGNEMVNYVRRWIDYTNFQGNRSHDRLYNSWGSPHLSNNDDATLAKADNDQGSQTPSSHFVEDASFIRLKSLQLTYTVPQSLLTSVGFSDARELQIYLQATNLFTLTEYSGLDPEVNTGGVNMGIDAGAWPTPRQVMFGVKIGI